MIKISVEGKELFREGYAEGYHNNVKMEMLDGSGLIITNDNIVGESLKMTERTCSGNVFKFGLCEAKSVEIECFDIPYIKGKRFFLSIEKIRTKDNKVIDTVEYGEFIVNSCKKQPLTGRRKVIAYDDLISTTLDKDMAETVNQNIMNAEDFMSPCIFQIEKDLLKKFGINTKKRESVNINWDTSTTAGNTYGPDDNMGYYVYVEARYLHYTLDPEEYYVFKVSEVLQEKREQQARQLLKEYAMKFSGMEDIWLDQMCYISIYTSDGRQLDIEGGNGDTEEYTNIERVMLNVKEKITIKEKSGQERKAISFGYMDAAEDVKIERLELKRSEKVRMTEPVQNVTLRNILSSMYELQAKFGKMNRKTGLLEFVKLNDNGLYPMYTLFPENNLYPRGGGSVEKGIIDNIWIDEEGGIKYGKLKLNYVRIGEDGNREDAVYEYVFDNTCNKTYEVKDNWILKNIIMTEKDIRQIAEEMGKEMKGIEVTPFSGNTVGLPYLEAGDMIEVQDGSKTKRVYILERTISGIQSMKDNLEALGGG